MWSADSEGKPYLPSGDPSHVPFKALWGNVEINSRKLNLEKEQARANECMDKQCFIKNGISKYADLPSFGRLVWHTTRDIRRRWLDA